ncbi:hypothetical protein P171DRAFT_507053 [Karstenula rhodostoma CBS 690.94]|uniref:Uncharacterized protein n=1 Tax=Karstenula rhodostoma CBS 690.94 TaxID=1392251 RepID=A0A9P4PQF1_9PLEO|nr:hypothetical protein P171DRAFT_507053 [Karstenula rhodostoma CBS 690.94]
MSTQSQLPATTKRLTLYCPSLDRTVKDFLITPSADFDQFLLELRAAFVSNLSDIANAQYILVTTIAFSTPPRAKQEPSVVFWERADDAYKLPRPQRYALLRALATHDRKSHTPTPLRLSIPAASIRAQLASIRAYPHRNEEECKEAMQRNWAMSFAAMCEFEPGAWARDGEEEAEVWGFLVLLSDMTVAQGLLARRLVLGAVQDRVGKKGGGQVEGKGEKRGEGKRR